MPFRVRLTVGATVVTAVLLAVVSAVFLVSLRSGLTGNLDAALLTRASDVVAQLDAAPHTTPATETGNGIYVQILTGTGAVVDGADVLGDRALLSPGQAEASRGSVSTFDRTLDLGPAAAPSDGGTDTVRVVAVASSGGLVVAAATSRDTVDNAVRRAGFQVLVLALALLVGAAGGAWWLARAALRRVESMRRQASTLRTDDAAKGIDVPPGRDELARLASTFNDLLARLRHAVESEQAFVADAGHELRTPLTVLRGELELARRPGRTVDQLRETVAVAAFETERLVRLSEDLLVLARSGELPLRREPVDLVDLVRTSVAAAALLAADRRVSLEVHGRGPVTVDGDPVGLRRAVDNIVANAVRFAPERSTVEVTVTDHPHGARVTVRDHGPGFPPEFLPRAFERFAQADPNRAPHAGNGTRTGAGLGLAIVRTIATAHGGETTAANHPAGGAVVTLQFPRSAN